MLHVSLPVDVDELRRVLLCEAQSPADGREREREREREEGEEERVQRQQVQAQVRLQRNLRGDRQRGDAADTAVTATATAGREDVHAFMCSDGRETVVEGIGEREREEWSSGQVQSPGECKMSWVTMTIRKSVR